MAITKTLQNILDTCYNILEEDETSTAYPSSLMTTFINNAQADICNGVVVNPMTQKTIKANDISFLYADQFYSTVQDNTLSADATVGASTLAITDSSSYASSGAVYVGGDVITYTGNTGTGLTGVSGIEFAHTSGTAVRQLYALPADFSKSVRVTFDKNTIMRGVDYRNLVQQKNIATVTINRNRTNQTTIDNFVGQPIYSILDDTYLIVFGVNTTGKSIQLQYYKKATELSNTTDVATIPDDYVLRTVPYMAVAEMLAQRSEEDRANALFNIGFRNTRMMYSYYGGKQNEVPYNQRIQTSYNLTNLNIK